MKTKKLNSWKGRCHCGAIRFVFETHHSSPELPLRSCSCGFCAKYGPRYTSDAQGKVRFRFKAGHLSNYDSDRVTKRVLCKKCGVYLGTILLTKSQVYAALNVNTFEHQEKLKQPSTLMDYSKETSQQRKKRQMEKWTPASIR